MGRTAVARKPEPDGLAHIEQLVEDFAKKRGYLVTRLDRLNDELLAVKRRRIDAIRAAAAKATESRDALKAAVEEHADLFTKPKTRTLHGIKVGFRKLIGTLSWDDGDKVVALIKKHFPEKTDLLIRKTETPVKDALGQLAAVDLKKLGVAVGEDTDEVVIKAAGSDIDKVVDALLAESDEGGDA